MKLYSIILECSPQVVTISSNARIVDVVNPAPSGNIVAPQIVLQTFNDADDPVASDLVDVTVYSIPAPRSLEGLYDTFYNTDVALRSVFNMQPTADSNMQYVGHFDHYYKKQRYYVYWEDLFSSSGSTNYNVSLSSNTNSPASRAISEDSLTRTIT